MYGRRAWLAPRGIAIAVLGEPRLQPVRLLGGEDDDVVLADRVLRFDGDAERFGAGGTFRAHRTRHGRGHHPVLVEHHLTGVGIEVLDETRSAVGVEMLEDLAVADVDLALLEHHRHRDDQREFRELALVVVHHADHRAVGVAHQHDLRRLVVEARVRLADVEAAERGGVRRGGEPDPGREQCGGQHRERRLRRFHPCLLGFAIGISSPARARPTAGPRAPPGTRPTAASSAGRA